MSWFGSSGSTAAIDEKILTATSESIPNGDIDFNAALEISDLIRSKQVTSKEAMRALKKRFINNKNPNLQKSSLKLIDFCIKNGGEHFLTDISSKEFMDPMVGCLNDNHLNASVKSYLLELIQSWSIMFSTNPKLGYVNQCYTKLQKEGFQFPMITELVDASLIESKVAPEWEDSDACMLCSTLFSFLNRKHHCRSCGGVFCGTHSSKSCELPELGITIQVRVCDTCYQEHKDKQKKQKKHKKSKSVSFTPNGASVADDDDDELRKAIELSLKESGVQLTPQSPSRPSSGPSATNPQEFEDVDEDMKAAIAASLADFKQQETSSVFSPQVPETSDDGMYANLLPVGAELANSSPTIYNNQPTNGFASSSSIQQHSNHSSYNSVTGVEEQNVVLFAQLISNYLQTPPEQRRPIADDGVLKNLEINVRNIQPKLNSQIAEQKRNLDRFQDLYSKTFAISNVYEEILETRLRQQHSYEPSYAPNMTLPNQHQGQYQHQYGSPQQAAFAQPSIQRFSAPPSQPLYQQQQQQQAPSPTQFDSHGYENTQAPPYSPSPHTPLPQQQNSQQYNPRQSPSQSNRQSSFGAVQFTAIPSIASSSPMNYYQPPPGAPPATTENETYNTPSSPSQLYPSTDITYAMLPDSTGATSSPPTSYVRPSIEVPLEKKKVEEPVNLIDL
ncbi:hypothetical protein CANARDRAFT_168208 [[Candida] arabinofermentans NRRL YB-2248]|uniref:Vacuolar protein sorting-associated protein 27 n=1 Tax=[Candida] arabinofermentans NRRL YB-2248 TaxID=983967 RepID=A0A1E4SZN1_9ASCO|nr:hypothetical protein CANARDRAFT_168208 [[Candida] arabinofermentans NRRL YB-2248]